MISAILLAAGQSKRMVGKNKLTKEIKGIPLIKLSVKNILASSIDELIIVLGHQKEIIEELIDKKEKIKCVFNKNFESGIASSIKIGLDNLSEKTEAFFICLSDMPYINKEIYDQLIDSKKNNQTKEIFVPYYENQQGNPILFSITMRNKINEVLGDLGAKKIIMQNSKKTFRLLTKDKGVVTDFNTQLSFLNIEWSMESSKTNSSILIVLIANTFWASGTLVVRFIGLN